MVVAAKLQRNCASTSGTSMLAATGTAVAATVEVVLSGDFDMGLSLSVTRVGGLKDR
jgi:hypothetical protein